MESNVHQTVDNCSCSSGCCGSTNTNLSILKAPYIKGLKRTIAGSVPRTTTELASRDILGAWMVRWGIKRMNYKVIPGLYRVGKPDKTAPVLVTANYKLTFDIMRKELTNLNIWILVLDTKGVNVWCAAGKGTFGTEELIQRVEAVQLSKIVKHRTLILPQLGATGVSAHEVEKKSGFHVIYGPVRACDIKAFLKAGMKAAPEMRKIKFDFLDRLVLTPVDFIHYIKPLIIFLGVLFILNVLGLGRFGATELVGFFGSMVTGCVITPIFLPWISGRAFSLKGALLGVLWTVALLMLSGGIIQFGILKAVSYFLLLPSVSAYTAMNFTGSSTYTSPTGVNKEMRFAIPIMSGASLLGMILFLTDSIIKVCY